MKKKLARTGRLIGLSLVIVGLMNWTALFIPASGAALRAHYSMTKPPVIADWAARLLDGKATPPERLCEQYNNLPLRFEAAALQANAPTRFIARNGAHNVLLTASEARVALHSSDAAGDAGSSPHDSSSDKRELQAACVGWRLVGANRHARMSGEAQLPVLTNYFIGKDAAQWRSGVTNYARVKVEQVYRGIDVVYYGAGPQLEYDFNVAAGADYKAIRLRFTGAGGVDIDESGDLLIATPAGEIRLSKPVAYQIVGGNRQAVTARYWMNRRGEVRFRVAAYNPYVPLVIDPVLAYSTYLGGKQQDEGLAITVDRAGNAYIAGRTRSADFPVTAGTAQPQLSGGSFDAFVCKLNTTGTALVYATYLGGQADPLNLVNAGDQALAIAVDAAGNAYITGTTSARDFPTTPGAFRSAPLVDLNIFDNIDAFVCKLNATGSALVYSTYLGGLYAGGEAPIAATDAGTGIAVDAMGNAYVAGLTQAFDFPVVGALQPALKSSQPFLEDAFITKLNPAGSALVYSTYLGGSSSDVASGIVVDASGNAYVAGSTYSTDFPVTPGALQTSSAGHGDGFVVKLDAAGASLIYATYLGGSFTDSLYGITLAESGNVAIVGTVVSYNTQTATAAPRSLVSGAAVEGRAGDRLSEIDNLILQRRDTHVASTEHDRLFEAAPRGNDILVAKLNASGTALVYLTYFGGQGYDIGTAIAADTTGNVTFCGITTSADLPTKNALQATLATGKADMDAYVARLDATGAVVFATYFGANNVDFACGVAVDAAGQVYVTGDTLSNHLPTVNALQAVKRGSPADSFVLKIVFPYIAAVTTSGKKLIITGEGFAAGAVILINGEAQATTNREASPATVLVAKKAARTIAPGQTVTIQVRNADSTLSNLFAFTRSPE